MAALQSVNKKFIPNTKDITYLNKNFSEFRQNLIEFAKAYYPNTYTDFNEASPGMMFMEMAAYVGDVLSFYIDNQFKENLFLYAQERQNIIAISQALGYKPRLTSAATVEATIYQLVPALGSDSNYDPDQRFFLNVLQNSKFSSNTPPSKTFRSIEDVNFADPTNRTVEVFSRDNITNTPTYYLVSKKIKLVSADIKTATFTFGSPEKFSRVELPEKNIISIISVNDSDGNAWDEVDYLGQDLVIDEREINPRTTEGFLREETLSTESPSPVKVAEFRKKPRRFTTRVNNNLQLELWFGSGINSTSEEIVTLNSTQIANTKFNQRIANTSLDPSDFLATDSFGLAPANTTLTVTYTVGGGVESNVASNTIRKVDFVNVSNKATDYEAAEQNLFSQILNSVAILNEEPARGGGDSETIEEIKQNTLAFFNAQNRVVTNSDYVVRTLALPSKFGSVAKVFLVRDEQINAIARQNENTLPQNNDENPFNDISYVNDPALPNTINLYVLGYNAQKKLTTLNSLVKQNLAKYLEQYRMLTDDVNILDAFVVNIGIEFDIVVFRGYNMNDVLARAIDSVKEFFNVEKWQINQPIILNDLRLTIGAVEGVQTITSLNVFNKYRFQDGLDYQEYRYPINQATVNDIIYPSLDPCIFEIRYPETDIIGNARQ